jgi:penicillin-binding protein 1B
LPKIVKKRRSSKVRRSKKPPPRNRSGGTWRRTVRRLMLRALVLVILMAIALTAWLDLTVRSKFEGHRWALPARIYARPLEIHPGLKMPADMLRLELEAAGYMVASRPSRAGEFALSTGAARIITRPFDFAHGREPGRDLRLVVVNGEVVSLRDARGSDIQSARLEPALIGNIFPALNEDRLLQPLGEYPPELVAGLVVVEDRDFFTHEGISWRGVARAIWANVRAGGAVQGASTITQQLAKNFFLTHERSLWRKSREAIIAKLLEHHFDKETILEAYMNEIYLGQQGARAIHGFGSAAHYYFGRPANELKLHESALLIALVRGGSYYNPRRNPERAKKRRDLVLDIMAEQGVVTAARAQANKRRGLGVLERAAPATTPHPAFVEVVRKQLRDQYEDETLRTQGLRIFTTLEPSTQIVAERVMKARLSRLERTKKLAHNSLQGAIVVVSPNSGEVLAMVGGRDVRAHGFNRALSARRPIGSLLKPVVFLEALESGRYTRGSVLRDEPISVALPGGKTWRPRNYNGKTAGQVEFDEALARSLNLATVRLGLELGVDSVRDKLRELGVSQDIRPLPSLLLGTLELTPLEVAALYQPLAAQGFRARLRAVRQVTDSESRPLKYFSFEVVESARPTAIKELLYGLNAVMRDGTGRYASRMLGTSNIAGKTGTTDELRDSWFAGFGRDRLAVVWLGRDNNEPAGLSGSSGALRVWTDVMTAVGVQQLASLQRGDGGQASLGAAPRDVSNSRRDAANNKKCDPLSNWIQRVFGVGCEESQNTVRRKSSSAQDDNAAGDQ